MIKFSAKKNTDGSYSIGQLGKNGKVNGLGMYLNPKTNEYVVGELKNNKPNGWYGKNNLANPDLLFKIDNVNSPKHKVYAKPLFWKTGEWCVEIYQTQHLIEGKTNLKLLVTDAYWDWINSNLGPHMHMGYQITSANERKLFRCITRTDKQRCYLNADKDTLFDPIVAPFTLPKIAKNYKFKQGSDKGVATIGDGPFVGYSEKDKTTIMGFMEKGEFVGLLYIDTPKHITILQIENGLGNGLEVIIDKKDYKIDVAKYINNGRYPISMHVDPKAGVVSIRNYLYDSINLYDQLNVDENFKVQQYTKLNETKPDKKVKPKSLF